MAALAAVENEQLTLIDSDQQQLRRSENCGNADSGDSGDGQFCSCRLLRQELRWRQLLAEMPDLNCFLYSQLVPVWALWLVRLSLTTIFVTVLLVTCATKGIVPAPRGAANGTEQLGRHHWTAYLTNWHLALVTAHLLTCSVLTLTVKATRWRLYRPCDGPYLTLANLARNWPPLLPSNLATRAALRLLWLAGHACYTGSVMVVAVGLPKSLAKGSPGGLFRHGGNLLLLLVDAAVSGLPFRLAFAPCVQLCGLVYLAFSVAYWHRNASLGPIYPGLLDWDRPGRTVAIAAAVLIGCVPAIHFAWWLAFRARDTIGWRRMRLNCPTAGATTILT